MLKSTHDCELKRAVEPEREEDTVTFGKLLLVNCLDGKGELERRVMYWENTIDGDEIVQEGWEVIDGKSFLKLTYT